MTSRLPPVEPGTRPALADIERAIVASRGRITPLYQVLLNSPAIATGWEAMLTAVRQRCTLDAALRELAILRVAIVNRAPYEFDAHVPHALQAGLTERQVAAVRDPVDPDAFDPRQRLVLALSDAMSRDIEVADALYAEVARHFDATEQCELVATIAAYNMVSRFLVALKIGHAPG